MNRKGVNKVIDIKQGRILLNSTAIYNNDNYKWLIGILSGKSISELTKDEFDNLDEQRKSFIDGTLYKELYKNSCDEWQYIKYEDVKAGENIPECSLCGERKVCTLHIIKNKYNNKEFKVGSSCINNYTDLQDRDGKSYKDIMKQQKVFRKKTILNNRYIGIVDKIDKWNDIINLSPIYISKKLVDEYNTLKNELDNVYSKYLKSKPNDDSLIPTIIKLVEKGDEIRGKMNKYVTNAEKEEWAITPAIKKWCEDNKQINARDFLMEDGKVTFRSAYFIPEEGLMKKIIDSFEQYFKVSKLKVSQINYNNKSIILEPQKNRNVLLECNYLTFFDKYGEEFFKNISPNIDFTFILENSKIENYQSLNYCSIQLGIACNGMGITLLSDDTDLEKDSINFLSYSDNVVYTLGLKEIVNKFKNLYFKPQITKQEKEELKQYILTGKSQTKDRYKANKRVFSDNTYKDNIYRKH